MNALSTSLLVAMMTAAACAPRERTVPIQAPDADRVAVHGYHATKLREVMAELDRVVAQRLPQELDIESQRQARFDEVQAAADALLTTAAEIPSVLGEVRLSRSDAEYFRDLADRLHDAAGRLHEQAAARDLSSARRSLEEIMSTCHACHTAFRVIPG
jgi:cytochrome c556